MIATCPECAARYRVDEKKVGPRGARIRCAKCSEIFRVSPAQASEPPALSSQEPEPGASNPGRGEGANVPGVVAVGPGASSSEILTRLGAWGVEAVDVNDGAEAMLAIQRTLPHWVILDAGLPGMNGRQICEFMKRNASLDEIKVLLVSADEDPRASASLFEYAPDANLQWADVPETLREVMEDFGVSLPPERGTASRVDLAAPSAAPAAADGFDEERARAERLARIVVSDIVLYQQEIFDRASREGTLLEDFRVDLGEGRRLLAERIDDRVSKERDYILEELLRVAEERREG
ncbi:MAG: zinc-ribbon domain-containing protein [Myxococcota bacterium]|jgi:predicted Zn finger-like uncharacterized protein|nr:zinc-ribbon domain-containing protein [Myxococcota bacterium]